VRLLLDTHVVLWWLMDDDTLSAEVKEAIDTEAEVLISAASVWEIAIKQALGKLTRAPGPVGHRGQLRPDRVADPITARHRGRGLTPAASGSIRPDACRPSTLRRIDPAVERCSGAALRRATDGGLEI
jgi:hypothetical protein